MKTPIPANAEARLDPARRQLLETYSSWLFYERRMVCLELAGDDADVADQIEGAIQTNAGSKFFFSGEARRWLTERPSGRAETILNTVGCNVRGEG